MDLAKLNSALTSVNQAATDVRMGAEGAKARLQSGVTNLLGRVLGGLSAEEREARSRLRLQMPTLEAAQSLLVDAIRKVGTHCSDAGRGHDNGAQCVEHLKILRDICRRMQELAHT